LSDWWEGAIEKTSLGALEQKKESHDPHHSFIEQKGYEGTNKYETKKFPFF
jgi:hypothetical protein